MLNAKTRQVMLTQDAILMKKYYFHEKKDNEQKERMQLKTIWKKRQIKWNESDQNDESITRDSNISVMSNDEDDENIKNEDETDDKSVSSSTNVRSTNTKLIQAMSHLKTSSISETKKVI